MGESPADHPLELINPFCFPPCRSTGSRRSTLRCRRRWGRQPPQVRIRVSASSAAVRTCHGCLSTSTCHGCLSTSTCHGCLSTSTCHGCLSASTCHGCLSASTHGKRVVPTCLASLCALAPVFACRPPRGPFPLAAAPLPSTQHVVVCLPAVPPLRPAAGSPAGPPAGRSSLGGPRSMAGGADEEPGGGGGERTSASGTATVRRNGACVHLSHAVALTDARPCAPFTSARSRQGGFASWAVRSTQIGSP